MTDILFGQSYYLRFDPKLYAAMQPYPPLGTMYAASYMRQQGFTVALFDAILAESEQEWALALDASTPTYAVIYEDNFNYLSKMCLLNMREAAFAMIQMARERDCTVIVAGSDASDHTAAYLNAGADFVLLGEGEESLAELLTQLRDHRAVTDISGIATRTTEGIVVNPRRPVMRQIDHLPFPAWDLIDVERYRRIWQERHGYYAMNMVTTRGCPYHCNWCAKPIWGQRYASRNPEDVAAELKWLKESYQPDYIWFADDIMGLKPGWWQAFADSVEAKQAQVPFKCLSRADLIGKRPDNVDAMARAGCDIVWLGAESGSQKILDAMEKGTTVTQIRQAAEALHRVGVRVAFFLQFGYPGETLDDIEQTIQLVRDCQPDDIGISVSYPLPGTTFHERVKVELGQKQNWTDSADLAMLYEGSYSTAFYRQLHVVIHKEFRARQSWQQVRQRPLHLHTLRELVAIAYRLATLPLARWRLKRLTAVNPHHITSLPHISYKEAAQPSPQTGTE